jgi:exoribonuclease-2
LADKPTGSEDSLTAGRSPEEVGYKQSLPASLGLTPTPQADPLDEGVPIEKLTGLAQQAVTERGLKAEFSSQALAEVAQVGGPAALQGPGVKDLRHLAWASIDNDDTRDIDQLAFAEDLGDGRKRLLVAIADVAESVQPGGAIDEHARHNTVTVYTTGKVFAMLPEQMSTDWTSLGPDLDRRALVTEMVIGADGTIESSEVYEAAVHNRAKLAYRGVSDWIEGRASAPAALKPEMEEQIRLQIEVGQQLAQAALKRGALAFEADRVLPIVENGRLVDLEVERKNIASEAVAHMMIATNTSTAAFLHKKGFPVFQRAVDAPQRWDRMREVAADAATRLPDGKEMPSELAILPPQAHPAPLANYLREYKERHPEGYPEVSESMLKLMGGGDYVVTMPGQPLRGHFGQGVLGGEVGYVHSTAPNRRYPDVVVQRLLKAAIRGAEVPYSESELNEIAAQCNRQESAAKGAERQVRKAAIAHYLTTQVGEEFSATVTGRNDKKGVFLKTIDPPLEGKLVEGLEGLDVGDKIQVRLRSVDMEKGHIDFAR